MTKTIICDIDGCLLEQHENYIDRIAIRPQIIEGTLGKLKEWEKKCYRLILITARKESSRHLTEETLSNLGIFYDHLIMGVSIGPRVLINDLKPEHPTTAMAIAVNLKRNQGIGEVDM